MGLLLGWAATPAIFVALLLQLMFFGFGGLLVLGVNTFNMALPALLVAVTLRPILLNQLAKHEGVSQSFAVTIGVLAGAIAVAMTTVLLGASLIISGQEFAIMTKVILATNIPLMIIEACVTGVVISFLVRTAPKTFNAVVNS